MKTWTDVYMCRVVSYFWLADERCICPGDGGTLSQNRNYKLTTIFKDLFLLFNRINRCHLYRYFRYIYRTSIALFPNICSTNIRLYVGENVRFYKL